jgi:CubicO group peptidase (beta-lactamase class C family)
VADDGVGSQVDSRLMADLVQLAGRRSKKVAVALVDRAASPQIRLAFIDADSATRFEIGSVTKGLTGMLLADAIDRDELSLDTSVGTLLPDHRGTQFGSIVLKELCTHTSGLPRLPRNLLTFLRAASFAYFGTDPYRKTTVPGVLRTASRQRLIHRGRFRYSNLGGAVAGHLVARAAGIDYTQLIAERIFDPLTMTETTIGGPGNAAPAGWSSLGLRRRSWILGGYIPTGGVVSTIRDMSRLALAMVEGSAPGQSSLTPIPGVDGGTPTRKRGMFWAIEPMPGTERRMVWLAGQTGGYSSFFGVAPRSSRAMIVLANVARSKDQQRIAFGLAPHFADGSRSGSEG